MSSGDTLVGSDPMTGSVKAGVNTGSDTSKETSALMHFTKEIREEAI